MKVHSVFKGPRSLKGSGAGNLFSLFPARYGWRGKRGGGGIMKHAKCALVCVKESVCCLRDSNEKKRQDVCVCESEFLESGGGQSVTHYFLFCYEMSNNTTVTCGGGGGAQIQVQRVLNKN